ncbi:hypothetical protein SBADM41S_05604 [Streptomyces badius]
MYALSRPDAVDSAMSSAGAVRTSTGKLIFSGDRSTMAFSSRSTVTASSRGTAYSISTNRTRRGLVNTLNGMSVYVRAERARLESLAIEGIVAGTARPSEQATWNTPLDSSSSSIQLLIRPGGAAGPALRLLRLVLQFPVCGNQ